jgi:hypothetical protein
MDLLTVIWWAAVVVGVVSILLAVGLASRRSELLVLAGGSFALAGVLGILSIGVIFLAAAAVCIAVATRRERITPRS